MRWCSSQRLVAGSYVAVRLRHGSMTTIRSPAQTAMGLAEANGERGNSDHEPPRPVGGREGGSFRPGLGLESAVASGVGSAVGAAVASKLASGVAPTVGTMSSAGHRPATVVDVAAGAGDGSAAMAGSPVGRSEATIAAATSARADRGVRVQVARLIVTPDCEASAPSRAVSSIAGQGRVKFPQQTDGHGTLAGSRSLAPDPRPVVITSRRPRRRLRLGRRRARRLHRETGKVRKMQVRPMTDHMWSRTSRGAGRVCRTATVFRSIGPGSKSGGSATRHFLPDTPGLVGAWHGDRRRGASRRVCGVCRVAGPASDHRQGPARRGLVGAWRGERRLRASRPVAPGRSHHTQVFGVPSHHLGRPRSRRRLAGGGPGPVR